MAKKIAVEVFITMDEDGNYRVYSDESDVDFRDTGGNVVRCVKIKVLLTPPAEIEDGPTVDVPDAAGAATEVEAA